MELDYKDIIIIVLVLTNVGTALATRTMLPPSVVLGIISTLKDIAARTPSKLDDELVSGVEVIARPVLTKPAEPPVVG